MRLWFEHCLNFLEEVKIGINWYRHSKKHPWFGFTIQFVFIKYLVSLNFVNDYDKYNSVVNRPRSKYGPAFFECGECKSPHLKFALKTCTNCKVKSCRDCLERHEVNCPKVIQ